MKAEKSVSIEISVAVSQLLIVSCLAKSRACFFLQLCLASFAFLVIRLDFPKDAEKCIGCQLVNNVVDTCARIVDWRTEATVTNVSDALARKGSP